MQDLKPSVFAQNLPANSLIRFSDDFGGETNMYQGFDVNLDARFRNGAFLQGRHRRHGAHVRQLQPARGRPRRVVATTRRRRRAPRRMPDGTDELPPRIRRIVPTSRLLGSYTLPFDIQFSGTYPVQPRRADRRRGSQHPGELGGDQRASVAPTSARNWTGVASQNDQPDARRAGLRQAQPRVSSTCAPRKRFRLAGIGCASTSISTTCSTATGRTR